VFFLGVAAVFLPMGLGFAALGRAFSRYHNLIFMAGGVFLLTLGASMLFGRSFSLPFKLHPQLRRHNALSVFTLGIFSAIATTCCAPVLAGVLVMASLPGSLFWGGIYALSYVLGMVAPLFLIAAFLDRFDFTQKFIAAQKSIKYSLAGKTIQITIAELIAGIVFVVMGAITVGLALTNKLFVHSAYQVSINIYLTKLLTVADAATRLVPEYVWAAFFVFLVIIIIKLSVGQFKKDKNL